MSFQVNWGSQGARGAVCSHNYFRCLGKRYNPFAWKLQKCLVNYCTSPDSSWAWFVSSSSND